MPETIVFLVSIAAVIFGADWLGNAATHIANRLSIPRVIIGATVVSLATTLPEITIAAVSGAEGSPELGLGTVFGSPIANIGLIFGILLLFSKPFLNRPYYSRTIQYFIITLILVFVFFLDGSIQPIFSVVLIILGLIYLVVQSIMGGQEESIIERLEHRLEGVRDLFSDGSSSLQIVYLVAGSLLLVLGAHFLVGSAVTFAEILGVPQIIIGFVLIAFGTSLPEAITTVNSVLKGRIGLSAGNLFGASVLDLTFALGLGSVFNAASIDMPALYLTIGGLAVLSLISLAVILDRVSPRIIGALLITSYILLLIWFTNLETAGLGFF
ncbi:MAG: hypothetical protein WD187_04635 [Candidatus Woykebacteria bacterium]